MKKKSGRLTNLILIVVLLAGLSLLLYPSVSDWWNSFHQSRVIVDYSEKVSDLNDEEYAQMLQEAREYNAALLTRNNPYLMSEEEVASYEKNLNAAGDGIMGYVEIPKIECTLPIYHGTSEAVLQVAIGHLEWTSLPTGGESTHSVLSGHRGLPSAKLFSELDKLEPGDTFVLKILDETLTYEVDQILIVEPDETESLLVEAGKDYCTLATCTPYGVNSHRLLVRGHRVENAQETPEVRITADAVPVEPMLVAPFVGIPMLLVLLAVILITDSVRRKRKRGGKRNEDFE